MKRLLSVIAAIIISQYAYSQITITAADMPMPGDKLAYSNVAPAGASINPGDSGVSMIWSYALTPISQGADTFQTAISVNFLYVVTVGLTAFGYKVADSIPGLPVSVKQVYTFFQEKTGPARFEATAFAANVSGIPTASDYSLPDVWYYLPLNYLSTDSSPIALSLPVPGLDTLQETGYRKTRVDGWGLMATPYFTVPVKCLRVRSIIHLVDSVSFFGVKVGFPRNSVEYKWLANGYHYPVLWVTSNTTGGGEQITSIKYLDTLRSADTTIDTNVAVRNVVPEETEIKAYPNPAVNGIVNLSLPSTWTTFYVSVFDLQSGEVATFKNEHQLNLRSLPAGNYVARILSGNNVAYVKITR